MLTIEKLFKEKLGDLKNIGGKFWVFFEEDYVSEKNYKNVLKKYQFLLEKFFKRKFLKSLRILKEKIQNFINFARKIFEFFQICGCFVL